MTRTLLRPFEIAFPQTGGRARAVRLPLAFRLSECARLVEALALRTPRPALVVMSGASNMDDAHVEALRSLIGEGLVPFAEAHDVVMLDGGTAAGAVAAIGQARPISMRFALVGIAPLLRVSYPGYQPDEALVALEPHHTHFVLQESDHFGGESPLIAALAWAAAAGQRPVVGMIINGGEIVREEALANTTGDAPMPLIVLEGSGRFADVLAGAVRDGRSHDAVALEVARSGYVHLARVEDGPGRLITLLEHLFRV